MRKRPALHCERLERRELPANSFSMAMLPVDLLRAAPLEAPAAQANGFSQAQVESGGSPSHAHWQSGLSSDAVGAFFADHTALGGLFQPATDVTAEQASASSTFESLPSLGWDADAPAVIAKPRLRVTDAEFWAFLRNYAAKAIRREELARGPLPDHDDIIQQVYIEWREEVPSGADAHARLLDRDSPERLAFRGAVRRVLDRTRYDAIKQRRRADVTDHEAADNAPTRDWADLEIDLAQGVGKLTARQRDILDLRRGGMTFEDIGSKLGMPRQRVFEAYSELLDRLTALYRD